MIVEEAEKPLEVLQERILKLEQDLARVQAELLAIKNTLPEAAPETRQRVSFEEAAEQVRTEYSDLLQRLSQ